MATGLFASPLMVRDMSCDDGVTDPVRACVREWVVRALAGEWLKRVGGWLHACAHACACARRHVPTPHVFSGGRHASGGTGTPLVFRRRPPVAAAPQLKWSTSPCEYVPRKEVRQCALCFYDEVHRVSTSVPTEPGRRSRLPPKVPTHPRWHARPWHRYAPSQANALMLMA